MGNFTIPVKTCDSPTASSKSENCGTLPINSEGQGLDKPKLISAVPNLKQWLRGNNRQKLNEIPVSKATIRNGPHV